MTHSAEATERNSMKRELNEKDFLLKRPRWNTFSTNAEGLGTWRYQDSLHTMSSSAFVATVIADLFPLGFPPLTLGLTHTGCLPGLVMLLLIFAGSLYTMWCVGRIVEITGKITFRTQWDDLVGPRTSWFPVVVVILSCIGCNVLISCFAGDLFHHLLLLPRTLCILIFSVFPLLPLCMMKDLNSLAYTSYFSVFLALYVTFAMVLRATDGSYFDGGFYYMTLYHKPRHIEQSKVVFKLESNSVLLLEFCVVSFLTHYNGCKYYRELSRSSPRSFMRTSCLAMGSVMLLYGICAAAGFFTFGEAAEEMILNSYSTQDPLMSVAHAGVAFSLLCCFPIVFTGLREAVMELVLYASPEMEQDLSRVWRQNVMSACLLALVTACAVAIQDAGIIDGLTGALCGCTCVFFIPCALYHEAIRKYLDEKSHPRELMLLKALMGVGVVLAIGGAVSVFVF